LKYKIVADSCCDVTREMKDQINLDLVPMTISLENEQFFVDDNFNIKDYIKKMCESKVYPKTSCPSIQDFIDKYKHAKDVFVVTISSKLSGTFNAAIQAKNTILGDVSDKFIHVFDSMSASIGETLISLKIHEYIKNNLKNNEIVEKVNSYIKDMKTYFLLENIDNLTKSGRLNPFIAKAASILNIKLICGSNEGEIKLVEKVRGYERAFKRFIDIIGEEGSNFEKKILGIAHCNCLQRALSLKEYIKNKYNFKDIIVAEMSGITTTYADNGGIVIAF